MYKNLRAICLGNLLESFDFILFGFLSPFIMAAFLPPAPNSRSILMVFTIFFISFLARPIGAVIFGYIGDLYGRKTSLYLSIIIMSIATFMIAILPSYKAIGILSSIILILLRIIQGLCIGGEMTGAIILSIECFNFKANKSSCWVSSVAVSTTLLGSILGAITCLLFSSSNLDSSLWRIPFLIGSILGIAGFYARRSIPESPILIERLNTWEFFNLISTEWKKIMAIAGIGSFVGILFYGIYIFPNGFLPAILHFNPIYVMATSICGLGFYMLFLPMMGKLADKIGDTKCMIAFSIALTILSYPIVYLLMSESVFYILFAQLLSSVILAGFVGPASYVMVKILPSQIRYIGVSFGYNLGLSIFGGTAPSILLIIIKNFGPMSPVAYFIICSLIGLVTSLFLHKNKIY